jgi:hypothetical protein
MHKTNEEVENTIEMLVWMGENEDDDEQKGNAIQFKAKAVIRKGRACGRSTD